MDELHSLCGQRALNTLTYLEQRAQQLVSEQDTVQEQLAQLQAAQAQIVQLRARRDQLKALAHTPVKGPLSLLNAAGSDSSTNATQRALLIKRHNLEERKTAYRLLGQSVCVVDARTLRACWDTSCDGQYSTTHYAELRLDTPPHPVLTRHTLPPFVPVDAARGRLEQGLRPFMDYVQRHLQAYHVRHNFVQEVQEQNAARLVVPVEATPSVDWLKLVVTPVPLCGGATVFLRLKFDDATSWLPTDVKVLVQESDDSQTNDSTVEQVADITELFIKVALPIAVQALLE